jgi:pimeloyl-ACP methyl ester carboxylesterase
VPVQIIWGDQDRILPFGFLDIFKQLMPAAQAAVVKDAGHLPHVEKSEEFCDLVTRFVQGAA